MDKDKILPLTQTCQCSTNPRIHKTPPQQHCVRCECYVRIAEEQRDADWERVKPLVEALEYIADIYHLEATSGITTGTGSGTQRARRALASLEKKD